VNVTPEASVNFHEIEIELPATTGSGDTSNDTNTGASTSLP
jgi:hypothetical protein